MAVFETLLADVRYSLRWLRRSPGFTIVAIASLAIGIGFNSALFTIVDAALFRPRPFAQSDRLVNVYVSGGDGTPYATSSYPDYLDFKAKNQVFTDLVGYSASIAAVKAGDQSRLVIGEVVTGNFFQMLGAEGDDRPHAAAGRRSARGAARGGHLEQDLAARLRLESRRRSGRRCASTASRTRLSASLQPSYTGMLPILQPEVWTTTAWVEEIQPAGIQDNVPVARQHAARATRPALDVSHRPPEGR